MKLESGLKELERQFSLCIKCKQCTYGSWPRNLPICPINERYRFFTYSGGGLIYLARGILLGLLEEGQYDQVLKVISKCTTCGYCGQTCKLVKVAPPYQNVTDLIRLLKINLVKKGTYISQKHKKVINLIKERKRPFPISPGDEAGLRALKSKVPNKGQVLVFVGCMTSYKHPEILGATIEILNKAKINYSIMDEEWCCGAPLIDLGNTDEIVSLTNHNLSVIKTSKAEKVLFLCPHCQEIFRDIYPQILNKEPDFEMIFITKYLNELINKNRLAPLKSLSYKVSYHDSCYLGRYMGDFDSARSILMGIPGLDLIEMNRNKGESYCCGAGGGARILDSENAIAIGEERLRDFRKTGAEVLATSCPLCKSQFKDLGKNASKGIVVKDVTEILRESLE